MTVFPDSRLLLALAAWTGLGVVVAAVPWLWPVAAAALLLLAALLLWDALSLRAQAPLECGRRLPDRFFAGRAADIVLTVHNPAAERAREVELSEDLPPELEVRAAGDPDAPSPEFAGVPVDPASTTTVRYTVRPRERGDAHFGPLVALERSPLGLLRRRTLHGAGDVARIYPDASRYLRPEALDPRLVFRAIGVRPQRQRGEGMEFESLRDYVPGDDPRRITWAASARRGRPVTRLTQHEKHHTVFIAVDTSRLMAGRVDGRSKLDFACDAALALAYGALVSGDRVGMATFADEVRGLLSPRSHKRELGRCIDLLRAADTRLVEADFGALLSALAVHQRQRALVIVLTDFVDADATSFRAPLALLGKRHRLLLVALRDRIYRNLDAPRRDHPLDLYRRLVLDDLLRQREETLLTLRRAGVQTLDLPPEEITAAVLNRYLQLRTGPEW